MSYHGEQICQSTCISKSFNAAKFYLNQKQLYVFSKFHALYGLVEAKTTDILFLVENLILNGLRPGLRADQLWFAIL